MSKNPLRRLSDQLLLTSMRPPLTEYLNRGPEVQLRGKRILVTGASSGIGAASARKLAARGADVIVVARRADLLDTLVADIRAEGGLAEAITADLSDLDAVDAVATQVTESHGGIDILINNAGRSIRRPLIESLERWHDLERTMALNYYSPLRLMRALVPGMIERGDGHVINVSTWGVMNESSPLFGAYQASKAALTAISRVAETEWSGKGVHSTTLYYPLVKTPMIEPTEQFVRMPGLSAEEAADWMLTAARTRPTRIAPRMAVTAKALDSVAPRLLDSIMKRGI